MEQMDFCDCDLFEAEKLFPRAVANVFPLETLIQ